MSFCQVFFCCCTVLVPNTATTNFFIFRGFVSGVMTVQVHYGIILTPILYLRIVLFQVYYTIMMGNGRKYFYLKLSGSNIFFFIRKPRSGQGTIMVSGTSPDYSGKNSRKITFFKKSLVPVDTNLVKWDSFLDSLG